MHSLKLSILTYIHNLGLYDYMAFAWLLITFFVLLILAVIIIRKSTKLSMFLILFSMILLFTGPFLIKYYLGKTIRAVKVDNIKFQKLNFSNTLIIDYNIKNKSKKPFKLCETKTTIYKKSPSKIRLFLNQLKPIAFRTILVKEPIAPNASISKRLVLDNFTTKYDINISVEAQCY